MSQTIEIRSYRELCAALRSRRRIRHQPFGYRRSGRFYLQLRSKIARAKSDERHGQDEFRYIARRVGSEACVNTR